MGRYLLQLEVEQRAEGRVLALLTGLEASCSVCADGAAEQSLVPQAGQEAPPAALVCWGLRDSQGKRWRGLSHREPRCVHTGSGRTCSGGVRELRGRQVAKEKGSVLWPCPACCHPCLRAEVVGTRREEP